jgi:hypothetical protein
MRSGWRRLCVALGAAALGAASAAGLLADDRQLPLRVWVLRLPGTELGLDVADMDGDGRQDLVAAHMTAETGPGRSISVYPQGPAGSRFGAQPKRRWDVPADACAFSAGDFDPAEGGEVVFLCPSRLLLVRGDGELVEVAQLTGFFDYPEQGALPVWNLARDLDGDGTPELIVPTKAGYTVFARREGGLQQVGSIVVPVKNRFGDGLETKLLNRFLSARARLRRVVCVDLDQDGRKDLVSYRKKGLARFMQRPDGSFAERPDLEEPLRIVEQAESDGGQGKKQDNEAFANVRLDLADVDEDGAAELLVTRTVGELGVFETLRTQLIVFRGREDGTWDEDDPDVVLNLKGLSADPELVDWDGDGQQDLVLSSYRMDMFTNVKRAITESMTITYQVYLRSEDEGALYDEEPSFLRDVEVPLEALEKRGATRAVEFGADLDGDGVNDMISRRPEGGLLVSLGAYDDGELVFEEDATFPVGVGRTEPPRVVDLDGDGADELLLEPFAGDGQAARTLRVVGLDR